MEFYSSVLPFKINFLNSGSLYKVTQFLQKIQPRLAAQIAVINLRFFHKLSVNSNYPYTVVALAGIHIICNALLINHHLPVCLRRMYKANLAILFVVDKCHMCNVQPLYCSVESQNSASRMRSMIGKASMAEVRSCRSRPTDMPRS